MDNSFNNINNNNININNNLHNIDLLMLGNKGKKYNTNNQILNEEDINNVQIILKEFKIYKKQIKNKINDLYTSFLDNSNNEINDSCNMIKCRTAFSNTLLSLKVALRALSKNTNNVFSKEYRLRQQFSPPLT